MSRSSKYRARYVTRLVVRRMKDSCYGRVVSSFEETREREIILSSERLERRGFCRVYVTNALTLLAIGMS